MKKITRKNAGSITRRTDNRFLVNSFMNFSLTEAYNTARTNIMFSLATKKKKTVAVTSYSPADGKSSTAVNLALTFAKTEAKVLLIDADMRKPSVQPLLKIKNSHGLSTLISGLCSVESAVNPNVEENLDVICAGPIPPNPAELLASPYMAELITRFQNEYDFIFIDTPPVSLVSDCLLLNNVVSGIIFIVREDSTRHPEIRDAIDSIKLANGRILGFVKVCCKVKKRRYGDKRYGYYKYGGYYGYYQDSSSNLRSSKDTKKKKKRVNDSGKIQKSAEFTENQIKTESVKNEPTKAPQPIEPISKTSPKATAKAAARSKHSSKISSSTPKPPITEEKNEPPKTNKDFESILTSSDLDDILSSVSADIDKYKSYLSDGKK